MSYVVKVVFGPDREYEFYTNAEAVEALDRNVACDWLVREMEALECDAPNPMGKVLVVDLILNLAKCAGEARFAEGGEWAQAFAHVVARLLDRPVARIDVENFTVG